MTNKEFKELLFSVISEKEIRDKFRWKKKLLDDKNWARTDSDYHKDCRKKIEIEICELEKVIEFLDNN